MTESEGTPQTAREFASREGAAGQPELRIEYTRIEQDEAPRFNRSRLTPTNSRCG